LSDVTQIMPAGVHCSLSWRTAPETKPAQNSN
jgi:hypothetical protein